MDIPDDIGLWCHRFGKRIAHLFDKGNVAYQVRKAIDPAFFPIEHMQTLRDRGHIAVAKEGNRTVGMAGFEICGTDPKSGRDVYEIRRIAVRKENEKRGIGSQLHRTVFERLRKTYPHALILIEAWDQAIMNQCQKMGYKECDAYDGLMMKGCQPEGAMERIPWYQEKGYKFFVYDPSLDESEPR